MKDWKKPELEILNVKMTFAGPGLRYTDELQNDPDEQDADHFS